MLLSKTVVLDHSAEFSGGTLIYRGESYVSCSGRYSEGKTIAKTGTGDWRVNEVDEDDSHTFVVVRSFLDQELYVRADYLIPKSGKISIAHWGTKSITDAEFCSALEDILSNAKTDYEYMTDAIFTRSDSQIMRDIYVGYGECPIATEYIGYLGTVNGKWYITTEISHDSYNPDGSPKQYKVSCYTIPDQYAEILSSCLG